MAAGRRKLWLRCDGHENDHGVGLRVDEVEAADGRVGAGVFPGTFVKPGLRAVPATMDCAAGPGHNQREGAPPVTRK